MESMRQAPPRAVVIVGDAKERSAVLAACRHLGLVLDGCTGSGLAGMALIETLAAPPDLAIVDLRVTDMDGADLIRSLSMLDAEIGLVLCGADCPRLQDTALVLAAALGMRACAAVAGPVSAAVLSAAVAECMASRGRAGEAAKPFQVPDAIDIRSGLLRDEFELYYQPKVALADCKPRGVEALLRWRHPRHGLLAPASFLPQAEAAGLIDLLTIKVLRMALDDSAALRAAGHMLPVAVNLSPRALANPDLAGHVADAVRRSGVPPQAVMFEVTEHTEIADLGAALRVLLKLRLRGHPLSLDDYGAGHASILQLSRIPFGEMKLDRRLVHQAWKRPHLEPLLRQAIESARQLGMTSVAEGIETPADWDFLRKLGCDQAQGYLIARPMPAANLPGWLRQAASAPPVKCETDSAPRDNA
jgi:EAL domain-containing protein (putative c-di-GMP-specific phosphodiesterase class I)/ActR/RegA family two-component response regulator